MLLLNITFFQGMDYKQTPKQTQIINQIQTIYKQIYTLLSKKKESQYTFEELKTLTNEDSAFLKYIILQLNANKKDSELKFGNQCVLDLFKTKEELEQIEEVWLLAKYSDLFKYFYKFYFYTLIQDQEVCLQNLALTIWDTAYCLNFYNNKMDTPETITSYLEQYNKIWTQLRPIYQIQNILNDFSSSSSQQMQKNKLFRLQNHMEDLLQKKITQVEDHRWDVYIPDMVKLISELLNEFCDNFKTKLQPLFIQQPQIIDSILGKKEQLQQSATELTENQLENLINLLQVFYIKPDSEISEDEDELPKKDLVQLSKEFNFLCDEISKQPKLPFITLAKINKAIPKQKQSENQQINEIQTIAIEQKNYTALNQQLFDKPHQKAELMPKIEKARQQLSSLNVQLKLTQQINAYNSNNQLQNANSQDQEKKK